MSQHTAQITAAEHIIPITDDADYEAFQKWERWYLSLRAHLHEIVNEEHGGSFVLDRFFDLYGLAYGVYYGNDILYDYLSHEPTPPRGSLPGMPVHTLRAQVEAAASREPVDFPQEDLPAVVEALRDRAEALTSLAKAIEDGRFAFPNWVDDETTKEADA